VGAVEDLKGARRDTDDFISRAKGGVAVGLVLIGFMQAGIIWWMAKVWEKSTQVDALAEHVRILETVKEKK
jgi:hypothetical protein